MRRLTTAESSVFFSFVCDASLIHLIRCPEIRRLTTASDVMKKEPYNRIIQEMQDLRTGSHALLQELSESFANVSLTFNL